MVNAGLEEVVPNGKQGSTKAVIPPLHGSPAGHAVRRRGEQVNVSLAPGTVQLIVKIRISTDRL